jgi:hypothetical protein
MKLSAEQVDYAITQDDITAAESLAADLKLVAWGQWVREGNSLRHLGYPPNVLAFRAKGLPAVELSAIAEKIDDDTGHRIYMAVRSLPLPYMRVIAGLYIARLSTRRFAEVTRQPRGAIDRLHQTALGMLSGKLSS